MDYKRLGALALFVTSIAGCGSSTSSSPPERPTASLSGVVFQGPIAGTTVRAYSYAGGRRGTELGQALTDASGRYAISGSIPSGVVLLEASGGTYREEATGRAVTVGPSVPLRTLIRVTPGVDAGGAIGTYTTLAAGLADYLVGRGRSIEAATDEAYGTIDNALGLDARATLPLDITNVANATGAVTAAHEYGFFEAALSQWTADAGTRTGTTPHTVHTSSSLLTLAYDDIRSDGILDGRGSTGAQQLGTLALGTDSYRHELALALLRIARSSVNQTGLTADQLLRAANRWNDSTAAMFGDAAVRPISSAAPTLANLRPAADSRLRGSFTLSVQADDVLGVTQVSFGIDGTAVASAGDVQQPSTEIDGAAYGDGAHTVYAEARNLVGGITRLEHRIYIDNTAPTVKGLKPSDGDVKRGDFTASATVTDAQMGTSVFLLDNVELGNQGSATAPRYVIDTRDYSNGNHTITLRATDAAGNITVVSWQVYFLNAFGF